MVSGFSLPVKRLLYAALLPAGLTGPLLQAQDSKQDSLRALRDHRIADVFLYTGNIAVIPGDNRPDGGFAAAQAGFLSGDFRRPMQPSSSSVYTLSTGGTRSMEKWRFLADFGYQKTYEKAIAWSAVQDPYEGNPFIWADSSRGDWDRDHIKAALGVVTSVAPGLKAGLALSYHIGTGARTSEPKPFYRSRDIALRPGVVRAISSSAEIGLTGEARFIQEENEIGFYSNDNVLLYRLRGYGTFSRSPFVSGERKRRGTEWGGTAHYRKHRGGHDFFVSATASQRKEEVFEGVGRTETTGFYRSLNWGAQVHLSSGAAARGRSAGIVFTSRSGHADDALFRAESASFSGYTLEGTLAAWNTLNGESSLLLWNLIPSASRVIYTDQAAFMRFASTLAGGTAGLTWRRQLTRSAWLRVQPSTGYYAAVSHLFSTRSQQVIIRELIMPDYAYFSTGYAKGACGLELEWRPGRKDGPVHRFSFLPELRLTGNRSSGSRTLLELNYTVGF